MDVPLCRSAEVKRLLGQEVKPKSEEFGGDVNLPNQQMQIKAENLI